MYIHSAQFNAHYYTISILCVHNDDSNCVYIHIYIQHDLDGMTKIDAYLINSHVSYDVEMLRHEIADRVRAERNMYYWY